MIALNLHKVIFLNVMLLVEKNTFNDSNKNTNSTRCLCSMRATPWTPCICSIVCTTENLHVQSPSDEEVSFIAWGLAL